MWCSILCRHSTGRKEPTTLRLLTSSSLRPATIAAILVTASATTARASDFEADHMSELFHQGQPGADPQLTLRDGNKIVLPPGSLDVHAGVEAQFSGGGGFGIPLGGAYAPMDDLEVGVSFLALLSPFYGLTVCVVAQLLPARRTFASNLTDNLRP